MKLIDYAETLLEDQTLEGIKKIRKVINFLDGNWSLLPANIVPFEAEEAREVRDFLVRKVEKM